MAEALDLVCGPADPLPESSQSFRLIERIGRGGQADVYKAVRRSAGVSSSPVTLKVFRPAEGRPVDSQFRSWDKGDAVLMDLLGRDVPGICRRIDAFYGPPPHRPGTPAPREPIPYQVLEYLPGMDLRQLLAERNRSPIDARRVLGTVAEVLEAMHEPGGDAHPALHMDIKPSNIIITPTGAVRVIDFTGARYFAPSHITTISYTPESAGPEARDGRVGPSYDVHGFGSVAFFLVTGAKPRAGGASLDAMRRHPVLAANPRLADHLLAPLADTPSHRPATGRLRAWTEELVALVASSRLPDLRVDWGSRRAHVPSPSPHAEVPTLVSNAGSAPSARPTRPMTIAATAPVSPGPSRPVSGGGGYGRGVAVPVAPTQRHDEADTLTSAPRYDADPEPKRPWRGPEGKWAILSSGSEFSVVGALFAFVGWGLWALDNPYGTIGHIAMFLFVLLVAGAVFAMARLLGTMVLVRLMKRARRTARLSHLASGAFLVIVGLSFLGTVSYISDAITWIQHLW